MADNTKIEWTDATWNIVTGCSIVSPGCTNCYAMKLAGTRLKHHPSRKGLTRPSKAGPVWTGAVRFNEEWLTQPLTWKRPRRIFVAAHGDLFAEGVKDEWLDQIFAVMALSPQHTFQVLTKRPERMRDYLAERSTLRRLYEAACDTTIDLALQVVLIAPGADEARAPAGPRIYLDRWPLPNVWLGVSVEDQKRADERIPVLLDTPAALRWISAEPLLGPIDLAWALSRNPLAMGAGFLARGHFSPGAEILRPLDWIVVGGESGPNARPMHPDWVRSLRDQCSEAGVPFNFKQWDNWLPVLDRDNDDPDWRSDYTSLRARGQAIINLDGGMGFHGERVHIVERISKTAAGRLLDGVLHDAFPEVRS